MGWLLTLFKIATTYGPGVIGALQTVWEAFQKYTELMHKAQADGDVTADEVNTANQTMNAAVKDALDSLKAHADTVVAAQQ